MSKTESPIITTEQIAAAVGLEENLRDLWLDELASQDDTDVATLVNEHGVRETVIDAWEQPVTVADVRDRYLAA